MMMMVFIITQVLVYYNDGDVTLNLSTIVST